MATGEARRKKVRNAPLEPLPAVWPFPTYKGQPYKPPRKPRKPKADQPDWPEALF